MSILIQVALVLLAIGVLILGIRIVRAGPKDDLARPLRFLHWGFWGSILSFALPMGAEQLFSASAAPLLPTAVTSALLAAFYIFACLYWAALGVLAQRTGRNWLLWVALGLATLAIGFIVSYILMAGRVRGELARTA